VKALLTAALLALVPAGAHAEPGPHALAVPNLRQTPEHCGPAALEMVLAYYGADSSARAEAERAYDPVLRGALITDLAAAARRAGFDAVVATLAESTVVALVDSGVPPILLYQNGRGPVTMRHFGVVVDWDPAGWFTLNDGGAKPRRVGHDDLMGRWRTAGCQALIVRRRVP